MMIGYVTLGTNKFDAEAATVGNKLNAFCLVQEQE
jgi:hypothetical protein